MGIEPTPPAWKAGALPLSYARIRFYFRSQCKPPGSLMKPSLVGEAGFEPAKAYATRFTVWPLWPLGNSPNFNSDDVQLYLILAFRQEVVTTTESNFLTTISTNFSKPPTQRKASPETLAPDRLCGFKQASGGTRTHNHRFTKPVLCRLSYASAHSPPIQGEKNIKPASDLQP